MGEVLLTSINAVLPIVLLILLGYLLKKFGIINDNFVKIGNKFVFKVCLPCMLFVNIYDKMNSFSDIPWDVVVYCLIVICVIFLLGLITSIITTKDGPRRGVILQCAFRSNFAIIGLALVESLSGGSDMAIATASIISAFSIPVFNILAVVSLSIFVREEGEDRSFPHQAKKILKGIVTNPLIIGVVLGLVFVGIREIEKACCGGEVPFSLKEDLTFLHTSITYLKNVASPLALVVLGGQFEFSAVKGMTKEIAVGTVWRIVLAPLLGVGVAFLLSYYTDILSFDASVYPTLIALFGTPVAVSSAIMAGAMKNDEQLATQYVVWTSLGSVITIFITVFIVMSAMSTGVIPS